MSIDNLALLVKRAVSKFPNESAVQFICENKDISLKYSELEYFADSISQFLLSFKSSHLYCNNYYVGVCVRVSYSFPCVIYGILKAGFAFVPMDSVNGILWNKNIIDRLKIGLIFTNMKTNELFKNGRVVHTFEILKEHVELVYSDIKGEILSYPVAYSVQTSGTTGRPKIIKVLHQSIIPNVFDLSKCFEVKTDDVIFLSSQPTFDPSIIEIFLALSNGATLLIVDELIKENPKHLINALFPQPHGRVTILQVTPSIFLNWIKDNDKQYLFSESSKLRILAFGGERCPSLDTIREWNPCNNLQIFNLYGISEVSCWAAFTKLDLNLLKKTVFHNNSLQYETMYESEQCFSEPLTETILEVRNLDNYNIGEMFIGSCGRICFIDDEGPNTLKDKPIFRSTGDLFKKDGSRYYFISRKKDFIKRFGVQLNLRSIAAISMCDSSVIQAIAHWYQHEDGSGLLGLFIIPQSDFNITEFKKSFKERCPKSSWPDIIKILYSIPLTRHGKINENSLNLMMLESRESNNIYELFEDLWMNYTFSSAIDKNKGFLSSGGTSFSALQLLSELERLTDIKHEFIVNLVQDIELNKCLDILKPFKIKRIVNIDSQDHNVNDVFIKKRKLDRENFHLNIEGKINHYNIVTDIVWKYNLGKCIDASPTCEVIEDNCYTVIGSHSGRIAVLETKSGKLKAEIALPDRVESRACIDKDSKSFFIGCYDGFIYSYSLAGDLLWSFKTDDIVKSGPVITDSSVICGSYDKYMYSLAKNDGKLLWKQNIGGQVLANPQMFGLIVIAATLAGSVIGLQINNGTQLWIINLGSPIFSNFFIHDAMCIVASVEAKIHWVTINEGQKKLSFKADGNIFSSLIGNEDCILFGTTEGWLYSLSTRNASVFWKVQLDDRLVSAPLLMEFKPINFDLSQHFIFKEKNIVLIASSKGCMYLINYETGSVINNLSLPGDVFSSPALGLLNSIIIGCRDNNVYCLQIKNCS